MLAVVRSEPRKAWRWGNTFAPAIVRATLVGTFGTPASGRTHLLAL